MSNIKPSSFADQPAHEAGKPVSIMCLDLEARDTDEGLVVKLTNLRLRNACMDTYGVGYQVEMPRSKKSNVWTPGIVSRRNFGLDNFSMDVSVIQQFMRSSSDTSNGSPKLSHASHAKVNARVWFWEKDKDLAVKTVNEVLSETMSRLRSKTVEVQAATVSCVIEEEPAPSTKAASRPK